MSIVQSLRSHAERATGNAKEAMLIAAARLEFEEEIRDALVNALRKMLPENCGKGDDPSGLRRPSFEKCEAARDALAKAGAR